MVTKIESLKMLIESQEAQRIKGNLTEVGQGYLNGLKCAYAILGENDE